MPTHVTETIWLNATDICSLEHIVEVSGLTPQDVFDLVDAGVMQPSNNDREHYFFHTECVVIARRARRLRDDLELDNHAVALAMRLLARVDELEGQLQAARARLLHK